MVKALYVPILTGKLGEFSALASLPDDTRAVLRPVLDLPPIRRDDDPTNVIDTLLRRVGHAFGDDGLVAVDLQALEGSRALDAHPVEFLLDRVAWSAVGVRLSVRTDAPASYLDAVAEQHPRSRGVCVRARVDEVTDPVDLRADVDAVLERLGLKRDGVHLCLDCGNLLGWGPRPDEVIARHLDRDLSAFALVSFCATSVPSNDQIRREERPNRFPRREWVAWRRLQAAGSVVVFGDYGITGPRPTEPSTGRPDPNLRYTTDTALLIWRGWQPDRLTEEHADEPSSFPDLCRELVRHEDFSGRDFSTGDEAYADIAAGERQTRDGREAQGSPTDWVHWATNHHIVYVVDRLQRGGARPLT